MQLEVVEKVVSDLPAGDGTEKTNLDVEVSRSSAEFSADEPKTPPASPTSKDPPAVGLMCNLDTLAAEQVEKRFEGDKNPERELKALEKLFFASKVINQTVGDALADMLLVEAVLSLSGYSLKNWDEFYHDLPNRQLKVKVSDRNFIQTTDAERKCCAPKELQPSIDKAVYQFPSGRAFAR